MAKVTLDYTKANDFLEKHELENMEPQTRHAHNLLHNKKGAGSDFFRVARFA